MCWRAASPRTSPDTVPRTSAYRYGLAASHTVTVTSGCCWIALYLARWISVLTRISASSASTHMTWLAIWPFGSCTAIVPKFLPVLARSRMAGWSMAPRLERTAGTDENVGMQRNVLGDELIPCSMDPVTGYYRSGCCENRGDEPGFHVVCCRV